MKNGGGINFLWPVINALGVHIDIDTRGEEIYFVYSPLSLIDYSAQFVFSPILSIYATLVCIFSDFGLDSASSVTKTAVIHPAFM